MSLPGNSTQEAGVPPRSAAPIDTSSTAPGAVAQTAGEQAMPSSVVADVNYPNVPETSEPQQAATGPGQGGVVGPSSGNSTPEKIPFKEQVNGYAKKFAGTVFGNKEEKEFGHKKLQGEI